MIHATQKSVFVLTITELLLNKCPGLILPEDKYLVLIQNNKIVKLAMALFRIFRRNLKKKINPKIKEKIQNKINTI